MSNVRILRAAAAHSAISETRKGSGRDVAIAIRIRLTHRTSFVAASRPSSAAPSRLVSGASAPELPARRHALPWPIVGLIDGANLSNGWLIGPSSA